jgi:hypothetical protein
VLQASFHWLIASRACDDGSPGLGVLSEGMVRAVLLGLAGGALAAAGVGLTWSLRAWRSSTSEPSLTSVEGRGVDEYISFAGVLISSVFLLAIVWTGLAAVMVDVCEGAR